MAGGGGGWENTRPSRPQFVPVCIPASQPSALESARACTLASSSRQRCASADGAAVGAHSWGRALGGKGRNDSQAEARTHSPAAPAASNASLKPQAAFPWEPAACQALRQRHSQQAGHWASPPDVTHQHPHLLLCWPEAVRASGTLTKGQWSRHLLLTHSPVPTPCAHATLRGHLAQRHTDSHIHISKGLTVPLQVANCIYLFYFIRAFL